MFDKFEVIKSLKLSCGLSFLLFGISDGHIFFNFSNYCPVKTSSIIMDTMWDPMIQVQPDKKTGKKLA